VGSADFYNIPSPRLEEGKSVYRWQFTGTVERTYMPY
jgi:hypothetical protein